MAVIVSHLLLNTLRARCLGMKETTD